MKTILRILLSGMLLTTTSCAYRLGVHGRTLPGGFKSVEIPLFFNSSPEPGIEVYFTEALIQEFEKNKVAKVVYPSRQDEKAPAVIKGEITSIVYKATSPIEKKDKAPLLPDGAVLATGYRVLVNVRISLVQKNNDKVIWTSAFNSETSYASPQVHTAGLNSVDPLYNLSSRRRVLESMAQDMMVEAHDRMTENF
jgi:hypothetical protein